MLDGLFQLGSDFVQLLDAVCVDRAFAVVDELAPIVHGNLSFPSHRAALRKLHNWLD
jgi:hypothetical protein